MRTPPPEPVEPPLRPRRWIVQALADLLVGGPWEADALTSRAAVLLDPPGRWLRPLIDRLLAIFPASEGRPPAGRVRAWLADDPGLAQANAGQRLALRDGLWPEPVMWPASGAPTGWHVPALTTPAALADWLELAPNVLDGLADLQGRGRRIVDGPRARYDYQWRARSGGRARLIEMPRPRLKAIQRRLLDGLLMAIPPHEAAHGFRPGRSVASFAAPHVGRNVLIRLDLADFFATVSAAQVGAVFRTAGYPEPVARRLAGLCTNRVPQAAWDQPGAPVATVPEAWRARRRFHEPHLPQGAPSSPALANLAAYRLDARLAALAETAGAIYTRYADDLAFSGDAAFARAADRFVVSAMATALDAGFVVNPRKTRVMRAATRQNVAGVVVNQHLNVARDDFDRLKATLHNCLRHGPASQNHDAHPDFRAHLAGRVAHVGALNATRGLRLRQLLESIDWNDSHPNSD